MLPSIRQLTCTQRQEEAPPDPDPTPLPDPLPYPTPLPDPEPLPDPDPLPDLDFDFRGFPDEVTVTIALTPAETLTSLLDSSAHHRIDALRDSDRDLYRYWLAVLIHNRSSTATNDVLSVIKLNSSPRLVISLSIFAAVRSRRSALHHQAVDALTCP